MPRPIYAEIDLHALRHNFDVMRRKAAGRDVWAVVKANAYGHGAVEFALMMQSSHAAAAGGSACSCSKGSLTPRTLSPCRP